MTLETMEEMDAPYSSDSKDRISALPDSLIHNILSFIEMKCAVQASVLSKRWRYIWTSLPELNFYGRSNREDFVNKVLFFRDSSCCIQSFYFDAFGCNISSASIYSWIAVAVRCNVEELDIYCNWDEDFVVPPCLCTCQSLRELKLVFIGLDDYIYGKIILPASVSLPRLKSMDLNLEMLTFDDEDATNRFFSGCPALESIELGSCRFDMNLNISSLKLKHFSNKNGYTAYYGCNMVMDTSLLTDTFTLSAPNLTNFSCAIYKLRDYSLENLSSLVTAYISVQVETDDKVPENEMEVLPEKKEFYAQRMMKLVRTLHNVKFLTLSRYFKVLSEAPEILDCQLPQFLNLHRLRLYTWLSRECMRAILFFLKISPNINTLCLDITPVSSSKPPLFPFCDEINFDCRSQEDYWDSELSLPCVLHHLKFVQIRGVCGCVNELKFIELLLKNSTALEKVVLFSYLDPHETADPLKERRMLKFNEILLTFPRASTCAIICNPSDWYYLRNFDA